MPPNPTPTPSPPPPDSRFFGEDSSSSSAPTVKYDMLGQAWEWNGKEWVRQPKFDDPSKRQTQGAPETEAGSVYQDVDGKYYQQVTDENGRVIGREEVDPNNLTPKQRAAGTGVGSAPAGPTVGYLTDGRAYRQYPDGRRELAPDLPDFDATPPTEAEMQQQLYRDQIRAVANRSGVDPNALPAPGTKAPEAQDPAGNMLDQYGQRLSLTRDVTGKPTGELTATTRLGQARNSNQDPMGALYNRDNYALSKYGVKYEQALLQNPRLESEYNAALDDQIRAGAQHGNEVNAINQEVARSQEEDLVRLARIAARKRDAKRGYSLDELTGTSYMASGGTGYVGLKTDFGRFNGSPQMANTGQPNLDWARTQQMVSTLPPTKVVDGLVYDPNPQDGKYYLRDYQQMSGANDYNRQTYQPQAEMGMMGAQSTGGALGNIEGSPLGAPRPWWKPPQRPIEEEQPPPQGIWQANGGMNMAGGQDGANPNGFMTDQPVGMWPINLRSMRPMQQQPLAVAGEAGPEAINVVPQGNTQEIRNPFMGQTPGSMPAMPSLDPLRILHRMRR